MRPFVSIARAAAALIVLSTAVSRAHQPVTSVTWVDDVAPIVASRCIGCHGASTRSSLRLDSYPAAHEAAKRIKREVLERRMPPWPAAPGFGDFANDPTLSALERELLVAWADGGAPRGSGPDPQPQSPRDRVPRHADLVLRPQSPAVVREAMRTFVVTTNRSADAWIGAWEFRPGNPSIVEQAEVSIVGGDLIGVWLPPGETTRFPSGAAQRLPAHSRVSMKVFYKKTSRPENDDSSLALYLTSAPRNIVRHRTLTCGVSILTEPMGLLSVRPRIHRSGESIEAVARGPHGKTDVLVWVPEYALRFEPAYRYREPVALERGTEITLNSQEQDCAVDIAYVRR